MDEILDQDEIDALLTGMGQGDIETESEGEEDSGPVQHYDFASQERIVRGKLPALDIINERFARDFQRHLNVQLGTSAEVMATEVRMVKMIDYLRNLYVPTSLNIVRLPPLHGAALMTLNADFVYTALDSYFGGEKGRHFKIEGREFSQVEQRFITKVLHTIFADFKTAWSPVVNLDVEYMHSEMNPKFANIVNPTELVVVNPIRVTFDGKHTLIEFVFPYAMLEPRRKDLEESVQTLTGDTDDRWLTILSDEIKNVDLDVKVDLASVVMSAHDVIKMKAGDVIPFEMPEYVTMEASGQPVFHGQLGVFSGKNSIKISESLKHPAYNEETKTKVHL